MSQGGRSQPLEWAMVHTLAWKHDIAEGGKTPFYHSVRFAPSLPVKHAICPRHRSSCWLIECDRAIHTLLPIRHHLLQKKITTIAQWQAVRQRAPTSTGPWLRVCPSGGGGKGQGLQWETKRRHTPVHTLPAYCWHFFLPNSINNQADVTFQAVHIKHLDNEVKAFMNENILVWNQLCFMLSFTAYIVYKNSLGVLHEVNLTQGYWWFAWQEKEVVGKSHLGFYTEPCHQPIFLTTRPYKPLYVWCRPEATTRGHCHPFVGHTGRFESQNALLESANVYSDAST